MEQFMALLQAVAPILVCIGLGFLARKKEILTPEQVGGVQQFVLKFSGFWHLWQGKYSHPLFWKKS